MMSDITHIRLYTLDKKIETNLNELDKISNIFKQIKKSYEQSNQTFAGSPIKLIKNRHL